MCLLSVSKIDQENNLMRKELGFMVQGMIICKLIGWDQIIFATNNPVPFLKTNADILEDKFEGINKKYLMILKLSKLTLQKNPFNKNIIPKL